MYKYKLNQQKTPMNATPIFETSIDRWTVKDLATRLFGTDYHTFYSLSPEFPQFPDGYMCWIDKCRNPAVDLALRNIHGSVIPFFGCRECCEMLHGVTSDDVPPLKNCLLSVEGELITKAA